MECDRLFVYGTLQSGQSRHHLLAGLMYENATLHGYRKIQSPDLGFPFIVENARSSVLGEVYFNVTSSHWVELDRVEGEGSLYHRTLVEVETLTEKLMAYVYIPDFSLVKRFGA
ncbi:MAG: gamma-glutamylcyclotransferase [Candidatus Thorarchaeota archaeon]